MVLQSRLFSFTGIKPVTKWESLIWSRIVPHHELPLKKLIILETSTIRVKNYLYKNIDTTFTQKKLNNLKYNPKITNTSHTLWEVFLFLVLINLILIRFKSLSENHPFSGTSSLNDIFIPLSFIDDFDRVEGEERQPVRPLVIWDYHWPTFYYPTVDPSSFSLRQPQKEGVIENTRRLFFIVEYPWWGMW